MLDIQLLRKDAVLVAERLAARGFAFDTARFETLEAERKTIQTRTQEAQSRRNTLSKQIGMLKGKGEDTTAVMAEVAGLGDEQKQLETRLSELQAELNDFLMGVPNLPHESVAVGKDETANVEVSRWGTPKAFDFPVRDHVDIGESLGQLDFEAAVKITGSRFTVMKGALARLHRALAQFMLDVHTREHGYTEVYVPYLVNADSMRGTGQLPKFEEDLFHVPRTDSDKLYLIPTAEVPVTNLLRRSSACRTARWRCAVATWVSRRPRPTTSRCGCRRRTPTAKSPPARISRPFRRAVCRRASRRGRASRNCCIR